jgi:hypothetical protein
MFKLRMPVLLVVAALLAGCGAVSLTGSGNVITQEEAISGFDRVDVSHGFRVDVGQGDTFRVVIRVDDNVVEHLEVAKKGDTLRIGLKRNRSYTLKNTTLEAEVTMPELTGLEMSGGSHATLSGSAQDLKLDASGGGQIDLGDFSVVDADIELSGGARAMVNPSGKLDVDASGGSHVYYVGNPTLGDIDTSGGSSVERE